VRVSVNGELAEVAQGATVGEVVASRTPELRRVAVAVNGEVVPRSAWAARVLAQDDAVEVLTAAAGG
jgi:sulfur carrier protein